MERLKKYHKVLNRCTLILLAVMSFFFVKCPEIQAAPKAPAKVVLRSVTSPTAGKVIVSWRKASRATRYQIQIATNKKFTINRQNKTAAVKKTAVTVSRLKNGKTYYVRVRAYRTIRGKRYNGKWSKISPVKTKTAAPKPGNDPTDNDRPDDSKPDDNKPNGGTTDTDSPKTGGNLSEGGIFQFTERDTYTYTGQPIEPKIEASYLEMSEEGLDFRFLDLEEKKDYTIAYKDNVNVGEASVTITGMGAYTGSITKKFKIQKAIQSIKANIEDPNVYMGKTGKIQVTGTTGKLNFTTDDDEVVQVSDDGIITPLKPGQARIYLEVEETEETAQNYYLDEGRHYVGMAKVFYEEPTAAGFVSGTYMSNNKTVCCPRNADGTNTYLAKFYCNADEKWVDDSITFTIEDITPPAFARIFQDMDVPYTVPQITEVESADKEIQTYYKWNQPQTITKPLTDEITYGGVATSGKMITVNAGQSVMVVKVTAFKNGEYFDHVYIGSTGKDWNNEYVAPDIELYKQVRERVEAKLWTEEMTNLEKLFVMAKYIRDTTHYPTTDAASQEYNPTFWNDWSVDGIGLYSWMFGVSPITNAAILQGSHITCLAAERLVTIATEDLNLPYLYDGETVADGEGVWIGKGSYSTNPTNPEHVTLIYCGPDGEKTYIDAQGLMYSAESGKSSCEAHDCRSKLVSLK